MHYAFYQRNFLGSDGVFLAANLPFLRISCVVLCLLGSGLGLVAETQKIAIKYSVLEDEISEPLPFYSQTNEWSPIYTTAEQLKVAGTIKNSMSDFFLLTVNEKSYPLMVPGGQFNKVITLDSGNNEISIHSKFKDIRKTEQSIIKIAPAEVLEIHSIFEGGQNQSMDVSDLEIQEGAIIADVSSPLIRVIGEMGTEGVVELKVKDSYQNSLPIHTSEDGRFFVDYTLREKSSKLRFLSTLNNREFRSDVFQLELQDIIEFNFDASHNLSSWITHHVDRPYPICQKDTVSVAGTIRSIKKGFVEIVIGQKSIQVPVEDHQFQIDVPLALNQMNIGRVKVNLNDQSFFESFRIEQLEPSVKINGAHMNVVEGSHLLPGDAVDLGSREALTLKEGILDIKGYTHFMGDLELVLERNPDGKEISIPKKKGSFNVKVPLDAGNYLYRLLLKGGDFSRVYADFEVDVEPAIKVEAVNHLPFRDGAIHLTKPELLLRGKVFGVKRGLLHLDIGDERVNLPVLNEYFEMTKAVAIPEDVSGLILSIQAESMKVQRSYEIELDLKEEAPKTDPEEVDE